jgi:hypothetical protein
MTPRLRPGRHFTRWYGLLSGQRPVKIRFMTVRRLVLALGALGLIGLVLALGLVPRFKFGMPLDPTAADVVPFVAFDAAVVETVAAGNGRTPGIEGSVLFVRMVSDVGATVLDRPFDWPTDQQRISPGRYALTVYWRTCSGNCGHLDPENRFCEQNVSVSAGGRIRVLVIARELIPGSECQITTD